MEAQTETVKLTAQRRQEIIEKIQACFRRSDTSRGSSQAEAETAIKMAKRLMMSYSLSQSEVNESLGGDSDGSTTNDNIIEEGGLNHFSDPAHYELELTIVCQYLFNVKPMRTHKFDKESGKMRRVIVFIGFETDVAIAKEVYNMLRDDVHALAKSLGKKVDNTTALHYKRGVVHELCARAKEQVADATKEEIEKCTALVVVKDKAVSDYMKKTYPNTSACRGYNHHDAAYAQGRSDGKNVSMNFNKRVK